MCPFHAVVNHLACEIIGKAGQLAAGVGPFGRPIAVVYGGLRRSKLDHLTAHRCRHLVLRLGAYIPFVPLMIIPYMSIDLFFAAAPFICSD